MRIFRACLLVALAWVGVSCVEHEHHAFDAAVSVARSDVMAHRAVIASSGSMNAAQSEVERHSAEIDADMIHIRSHLGELDWSCDSHDMGWVWDKIDDIEDRIALYLRDAGNMTDLGALDAICGSYASDMDRLFAELRGRLDQAWCW
jgi:hypothetical protein